jgi:MFS family permease
VIAETSAHERARDPFVWRITVTLFLSQSLVSAALIAGATVNPIVGAQLSSQPALAGLLGTLVILGAACAAYPAGQLLDRLGRRTGLLAGMGLGLLGSLVAALAVAWHSFAGFLLATLGFGALSLIGAALALTPLALVLWQRHPER